MDVYRIIQLFSKLMSFYPDEIKVILEVVRSDYFDNRDVELSFIAAENMDVDSFEEFKLDCPAISEISFERFCLFFKGPKICECKDIMEEIEEEDIDLTFDILELVANLDGSEQDKYNVVFAKYRTRLCTTHEGNALLEDLRKYIK